MSCKSSWVRAVHHPWITAAGRGRAESMQNDAVIPMKPAAIEF